jgi:hypothetical protein
MAVATVDWGRKMKLKSFTTISPRPMGDLNAAMRDLDLSGNAVRALLQEGKLIGFNISAKKSQRNELRILTKSVEHFRETAGQKTLVLEWLEIFRLILPQEKLSVRGMEIQRSLNCDRGHVENLILSAQLFPVKKARPGPGGSPIVTRESYELFLKGRMQ